MHKYRLSALFLITAMLIVAPLNALGAEVFFKDYVGQTIAEVIKAEGPPDEQQQKALIYQQKIIDGREFTVTHKLDGTIVDSAHYYDKDYENVPVIEPSADWSWLSDIGKTYAEITARWGLPQWYFYAGRNLSKGRLAEEYNMTYHNVNLNGHLYSINYMFYNNIVIRITGQTNLPVSDDENAPYFDAVMAELKGVMDEPVWIHRINPRLKKHIYYLADDKYLATIDNLYGNQAFPLLCIMIQSHDTDFAAAAYIGMPSTVGMMMNGWERNDVAKGGDYAKLVKVEQKIMTQMEEVEKNMPAAAKEVFFIE